jgi:hypothetical protein
MFRFEVEWILRKIILSAKRFCGGALQIHRREIIQRLREPVRHIESKSVGVFAGETHLSGVIGRILSVGEFSNRGELARTTGRTICVYPPTIGVLRSGSGTVHRGVGVDVPRQVRTLGSDIPNLK